MSHILSVYTVDLAELEAVVGSGDEQLLNRILAKYPAEDDAAADGGELGPRTAIRALIAGGPFDREHRVEYVEALETVCQELGDCVGDVSFWFGYENLPDIIVDLATNRGYDGPFPDSDDNGWGYMSKEECAEELAEWETAPDGEIEEGDGESGSGDDDFDDEDFGDDDEDYREAIIEWCRASKETGKDLIGFYGG